MSAKRPFVELQDACSAVGWYLTIERSLVDRAKGRNGPLMIIVHPNAEASGRTFSRAVRPRESFDRCARIILDALRADKLLR